MADTAADILMETIHDWGVDVIFGLPYRPELPRCSPHQFPGRSPGA
jgi:thiamine pyrophosphate-dependent acetolactate synthase large subunit-like protein